MLQEIGKIPINPDAHYTRGLNDFFVWSEGNNKQNDFLHVKKEKINDTKVTKGKMLFQILHVYKMSYLVSEAWNPVDSVVEINPYVNSSVVSLTRTSSAYSEKDDMNESFTNGRGWEAFVMSILFIIYYL